MTELCETELCKIAYKYGTDKCQRLKHSYTPFYYEMFKDRRQEIRKVLEVGIGSHRTMRHVPNYVPGASLRMWREFFPNAQVYGADFDRDVIFEEERIKTYYCDETKTEDIVKLVEQTGSDIDFVVDDASHYSGNQLFLCQNLMPLLKEEVIYIIEDVAYSRKLMRALSQYNCECPFLAGRTVGKQNSNKLLIVGNK